MKWFLETDGAIESSATIDKDRTIYIASTDGKLYAIGKIIEINFFHNATGKDNCF
ncbi:MAG: PQQ-binding-like beta-propeller repeat protein [Candidatus Scalindua sp.]|nr:PQQ-binding-like beta-propeller repeat protein [Candidatus Scalindua sp.]